MNADRHHETIHQTNGEYWHGLAALRGVAMLLGVVLHAAIPFMGTPFAGLHWVYFQSPSLVCDVSYWWIHSWRIPLFFFLAGFFALQTTQRHGVRGFATRRFKRLVVPYFAAVYTVGPLIYLVFHLGWYLTGQCTWDQMWPHVPLPEKLQDNFFGPAHLWFLQELIILSFAFLLIYSAFASNTKVVPPTEIGDLPWWLPICPGFLSGLMLWSDTSPLLEWHNTFLCVPARLLFNSVYFIGGIIAYRHRASFFRVTSYYHRHLALAALFSVLYLWLRLSGQIDINAGWGCLWLSLSSGILCWLLVYGLIGGFNVWFAEPRSVVSYLSDASYWVYIIHLPIVATAHLAVRDLSVNSATKFMVATVVTAAVSLVSYQWFVRYTFVGAFLHGRRIRHRSHQDERVTGKVSTTAP